MKPDLTLHMDDRDKIVDICKALSSPIRLDILHYLADKPAIISDVATKFDIPLSSAALYIKVLENAGLISVQPIPGSKGSQKLCGVLINSVAIDMFYRPPVEQPTYLHRESMPVGCYFDFDVRPSCGMVSESQDLGFEDNIGIFTKPSRFNAQLIWLSTGYLEYRFSNLFLKQNDVNRIRFSFEICSEALGYNNDWPSDVTISINNRELGILHLTGDYGDRRGKLNPEWWNPYSTQYGLLRTIEITGDGTYFDGNKVSDQTISSMSLKDCDYLRLKLEVKEDAKYKGGFNLFGSKFGDYQQDILMELYHD